MDRSSLTYLGFLALLFTQAWISRTLPRKAAAHWKGRKLLAARAAIHGFGAAVVACDLLSCLPAGTPAWLPEWLSAVLGGLAAAYAICATGGLCLWLALRSVRKHLNAETDPSRRHALNTAGALVAAGPFAAVGYGALVQRIDFHVREVDVPIRGLAQDLDGLRIVQLSDIHLSAFLSESEFARAVDAANELRPNLAVVTGDLITGPGDPLDACIRQIARLKADAGVFGCMGNHEKMARAEDYAERAAAAAGVRFLRQSSQRLAFGAASLNLAGVDYQSFRHKEEYLRGAGALREHGAFNLLLSHNPDTFPAAARQGWNLQLSGHTHGGQVNVEILDQGINPARFFTPYVYGLFERGASAAYVTRGIGTLGIPVRLGAPPEIAVLRLRKA
ncbi:MAG TPA: metallophosphoesterase [Bryobacteraceae bacterium]|nr:metallophosphoesterase [Bryobacteraceae bacterium]